MSGVHVARFSNAMRKLIVLAGDKASLWLMWNGAGSSDSSLGLLLSALLPVPIGVVLLAYKDRKQREKIWGDPRITLIAIKPSSVSVKRLHKEI